MSHQFPALIILIPLLCAFLISVIGWIDKKLCFPLALISISLSFLSSIGLLTVIMETGTIEYRLGGWSPPWGIAYYIDHLNALVLLIVNLTALLNTLATRIPVQEEFGERIGAFYTLYILFMTGLSGIVITGDAFNLYVHLEIAALTGYALIGMGSERAPLASLNYVLMGTIGASFYLLGVGYLYLVTGSLNMMDLSTLVMGIADSDVVRFAFVFCMTGVLIKMAFFPLHQWLPNAYSSAPSSAGPLIAALTTKVMIYVMIRLALSVFTPEFSFEKMHVDKALVWMSVIGIVVASILAYSQTRLKKMLSYIVIVEVGYMVGGFWLGNRMAMTGAILHIVNDAMMTLCVFLAAGNIVYRAKSDEFEDLKGMFRKMPFSMAALVVGALSIIGVPPTCGFFSKWYLISGGIQAGHYGFVIALLFSSLINVVLFFRVFEICYYEPFNEHHGFHDEERISDTPPGMLAPLLAVAAMLIVLGILTDDIVIHFIRYVIPETIL